MYEKPHIFYFRSRTTWYVQETEGKPKWAVAMETEVAHLFVRQVLMVDGCCMVLWAGAPEAVTQLRDTACLQESLNSVLGLTKRWEETDNRTRSTSQNAKLCIVIQSQFRSVSLENISVAWKTYLWLVKHICGLENISVACKTYLWLGKHICNRFSLIFHNPSISCNFDFEISVSWFLFLYKGHWNVIWNLYQVYTPFQIWASSQIFKKLNS